MFIESTEGEFIVLVESLESGFATLVELEEDKGFATFEDDVDDDDDDEFS